MADGASFQIDLAVTGAAAADTTAAACANLADKLTAAGAASAAASAAVTAGEAAYARAERSADSAAKALERIGVAADAQRGKLQAALDSGGNADAAAAKLQNLLTRQSEAAAKAASTASAMNAEAASLDKLKVAASAAADNEAKLSKQQAATASASKTLAKGTDDVSQAAGGGTLNLRALSGAFGKLGGPLGSIGQQVTAFGGGLQKMTKVLGDVGPYVAAAVVAVALAAAFAVATLAIAKFGIESSDTARTQALLSDGIAGSVAGGRQLDKTFADLANKVPLSREELSGMASDLAKSGLKGDALSSALETAATKAAKLKFGPDFAKQMLSLDNQASRFKSNVAGIFSGLKIEGLLEGLQKLVALFDTSTVTGKAMKVVFESLFQPVVDGLTSIIPKARTTFIQLEILALKAMIAIKPYGSVLQAIGYGFLILGAVVVGAVAIFVGAGLLMVAAFAALLGLPFAIKAGFDSLGASIQSTIGAVTQWFTAKFAEVSAFLEGLSFADIGTNLIMGLANGITGAGGAVLSAITGVVGGAVDAAKAKLGIASPSKVFAEIGANTAAGMAGGVDDNAGDVKGSLESMVAPPETASAGAGAAKGSSSSGGGGGSFAGAVFNLYGVEGAEDAEARIGALLTRLLEGDASQLGGQVPA